MKRQEIIKLMGVAAVGHVITPTLAGVFPVLPEAGSIKLFRLIGEHVDAWCSASSIEDAERLFEQELDPLELSATALDEVPEEEWEHYGIRKVPESSLPTSTSEARLLICNRGEFH